MVGIPVGSEGSGSEGSGLLLSIQSRRFSKLKLLTSVKRHSLGSVGFIGSIIGSVKIVVVVDTGPVSYTHLTLPTKRIV